jgi:hypothetical protein
MVLKYKRSQSSIEFIILLAFLIFFFILFFLAIQGNVADSLRTSKTSQLKEIALTIQDEINLASKTSDGYSRRFEVQNKVGNEDYSITITGNMVYLKTSDNRDSIALPIQSITGNVVMGENIIRKENGKIYLNS